MLAPRVEVRAGDFLEGEARERVRQRLQGFVRGEIERRLAPLFAAQALPLAGPARGLVFQLSAALGCVPTEEVAAALKSLDRPSRRALARLGVRFGTETIYVEPLLGPDAVRFRALLWAVRHGRPPPAAGRDADPARRSRSIRRSRRRFTPRSGGGSSAVWRCGRTGWSGWRRRRAVALAAGRFAADAELAALAGVAPDALRRCAAGARLSRRYRRGREFFVGQPRRRASAGSKARRAPPAAAQGHPFAKLKELKIRLIAQ